MKTDIFSWENLQKFWLEMDHRWIQTFVIIMLLTALYTIGKRILYGVTEDPKKRFNWKKGIGVVLVVIALITIVKLWLNGVGSILTFMGIIAAALTIASKELILNFFGSVAIFWRDLFVFGDRIQIGDKKGDVIDLGILYITLYEVSSQEGINQSTGRIVKIPNGVVFTQPVVNYSSIFPFVWDDISFVVKPDCDWKTVRSALVEIGEVVSEDQSLVKDHRLLGRMREHNIIMTEKKPKVYVSIQQENPKGVKLSLRFLCEHRHKRDSENQITELVLTRFRDILVFD